MNSQITELYAFLRSCRGSWREAIYIECRCCPYGNPACSGYLLTADRDGAPLLFSVSRFSQLTGDRVQKEECAAVFSRQVFEQSRQSQAMQPSAAGEIVNTQVMRIKAVFKPYWR